MRVTDLPAEGYSPTADLTPFRHRFTNPALPPHKAPGQQGNGPGTAGSSRRVMLSHPSRGERVATVQELQDEERRIRYVRFIVDFTSGVIMQGTLCKEPCPDAKPKRWFRRPARGSSSSFLALNIPTSSSTRAGFIDSSKNFPSAGAGQSARADPSAPNPETVKRFPFEVSGQRLAVSFQQ